MFKKVVIIISLFTFLFVVNVGAASIGRKSAEPSNFKTESNSTGEQKSHQTEVDQISAEMEDLELLMDYPIVGWYDDVTLAQKALDILAITGWVCAWIGLFAVMGSPLGPIVLALSGLAFTSFAAPFALDNMLASGDGPRKSN